MWCIIFLRYQLVIFSLFPHPRTPKTTAASVPFDQVEEQNSRKQRDIEKSLNGRDFGAPSPKCQKEIVPGTQREALERAPLRETGGRSHKGCLWAGGGRGLALNGRD